MYLEALESKIILEQGAEETKELNDLQVQRLKDEQRDLQHELEIARSRAQQGGRVGMTTRPVDLNPRLSGST